MKQLLNKIAAFSIALLVLVSTMSFTISEHYCGDTLVATALFSEADSCGMDMQESTPLEGCTIKKSNCCNDVVKTIEGQDNLKVDYFDLTIQQQLFLTTFAYSYVYQIGGLDKKNTPFKEYSPPFLVKDIQVLDEVYLI